MLSIRVCRWQQDTRGPFLTILTTSKVQCLLVMRSDEEIGSLLCLCRFSPLLFYSRECIFFRTRVFGYKIISSVGQIDEIDEIDEIDHGLCTSSRS